MKSLIFTTMLFLALLYPLSSTAHYNINLQNGEVLQAEDYKVEGNKINVRFTVGSASFPLSMVNSVTDQTGRVSTFSSTGEPQTTAPTTAITAVPTPATSAPAQPKPPQATAPPPPGPPSAVLDPLTARGGAGQAVDDSDQQETEETTDEESPDDDESSISDGAVELTP